MASLTRTVRRRMPAMPAHRAPAAAAASIITTIIAVPGREASRARPTPAAATAPITTCPSPPTFTRPARAGMATARAANTRGAAFTMTSPSDVPSASECHMSEYTDRGSAPLVRTKAPNRVRAAA